MDFERPEDNDPDTDDPDGVGVDGFSTGRESETDRGVLVPDRLESREESGIGPKLGDSKVEGGGDGIDFAGFQTDPLNFFQIEDDRGDLSSFERLRVPESTDLRLAVPKKEDFRLMSVGWEGAGRSVYNFDPTSACSTEGEDDRNPN